MPVGWPFPFPWTGAGDPPWGVGNEPSNQTWPLEPRAAGGVNLGRHRGVTKSPKPPKRKRR